MLWWCAVLLKVATSIMIAFMVIAVSTGLKGEYGRVEKTFDVCVVLIMIISVWTTY